MNDVNKTPFPTLSGTFGIPFWLASTKNAKKPSIAFQKSSAAKIICYCKDGGLKESEPLKAVEAP